MSLPRRSYLKYIILAVLGLLAMFTLFWAYSGRYPIALVEGTAISAQEFQQTYRAADIFAKSIDQISATSSTPTVTTSTVSAEAAVLDQLVEDMLVSIALERDLGKEMKPLLDEKLKRYRSDRQLTSAAQKMLGMNYEDFEKMVMLPQARRDLWEGRLFLKGQKIDDWIKDARAHSRIIIFSDKFQWQGGKVVGKML